MADGQRDRRSHPPQFDCRGRMCGFDIHHHASAAVARPLTASQRARQQSCPTASTTASAVASSSAAQGLVHTHASPPRQDVAEWFDLDADSLQGRCTFRWSSVSSRRTFLSLPTTRRDPSLPSRREQLSRPVIVVLDAHDVILAEIAAGLHLDQLEVNLARIFEAMPAPLGT